MDSLIQLGTPRPKAVQFVMVGGFLGAGKTTTLGLIGRRLAAEGRRVAVLTNDEVDTSVAQMSGLPVREVTGGCFCARFGELINRCEELLEVIDPDVLLAEPVGSFADLSATVLAPLKRYYGSSLRLAPYSVLADADRLDTLLGGPQAASPIGYLFRKQMEEADLLLLNKADKLSGEERDAALATLAAAFPATPARAVSALTGEGVAAWWQDLADGPRAGLHILDIDYDAYAEAENSMAWLETQVTLTAAAPFEPVAAALSWLSDLRHQVVKVSTEIGHIKVVVRNSEGATRISLTSTAGRPAADQESVPPTPEAVLTLTARVVMEPEELERLVLGGLRRMANSAGLTPQVERLKSYRSTRPQPVHRLPAAG